MVNKRFSKRGDWKCETWKCETW